MCQLWLHWSLKDKRNFPSIWRQAGEISRNNLKDLVEPP
jgi:beta-mannanase